MKRIDLLKNGNGKGFKDWIKEQEAFVKGYRQALLDKDDFADSVEVAKMDYVLKILKYAIPSDNDFMSNYTYKLTDTDYALIVETGKGIIDWNAEWKNLPWSEMDKLNEQSVSKKITWSDLVQQNEE